MSVGREEADGLVATMTMVEVRSWFDELDQTADSHSPGLRQFYLALYRRLHG